MKIYVVVLAVVVLFIFAFVVSIFANDIIWDDIGGENLNLRTVLVNSVNPRSIYIGSNNAVLKSEDGGANWRNILSVRGQNKAVNFLLFGPQDKNSIYAATGNGLFYSINQGKSWKRIFQGKNYLENECTTLAILSYGIYLGTKGGLFVSKDKGRTWHRETAKLGNSHILAITHSLKEPNYIYVACIDGVYRTQDSGRNWERVKVSHPVENGGEIKEAIEDQDKEERFSDIRDISCDPGNPSQLYLATAKGVYYSRDKGESWESLSEYGLLSRDIRQILISPSQAIYAATKSGIFEYKGQRWQELSFGLSADNVRYLALDNKDNLYAVSDRGLFRANLKTLSNNTKSKITTLFNKDEPSINEVQAAAIRYAEVEPEKIIRWRSMAAKKAILPKVSISLDRNVTDLWHWEGGSTTKICDDVLTKGHDALEWGVSLSWDLSELIWNDAQTSIDVRSRLMVELRDDILDEVTKLYFERIRVKMELDNLSIEDRKKRFEKELRLQELTAYLDALTGGYFSNHIKGEL